MAAPTTYAFGGTPTLAMIESADGLRNAREILASTASMAAIGPTDLSVSLGHSPDPPFPQPVEDGIAAIAAAARETGRIAGIHAFSVDDAKQRIAQGFRFITVMAEIRLIRAGATQALAALRG